MSQYWYTVSENDPYTCRFCGSVYFHGVISLCEQHCRGEEDCIRPHKEDEDQAERPDQHQQVCKQQPWPLSGSGCSSGVWSAVAARASHEGQSSGFGINKHKIMKQKGDQKMLAVPIET